MTDITLKKEKEKENGIHISEDNDLQEKLLEEQEEIKQKYGRNYSSYEKANFLSKIFFVWVFPLMKVLIKL